MAIAVPALHTDRSSGQAVLIILMALAFAAIVLAKLSSVGDPASASDASPDPNATAVTSSRPSTAATAAPTTVPDASVVPTAASSGSIASREPSAQATRTYKVKSGDTLIGIARKFGMTLPALQKLNGITNPSSLKIGQTLKIP